MARSLVETLNEAVQASARERDQEAWNLPRPPGEPIVRRTYADARDGESEPGGQGAEPPAMAPERTE